MDKYDWMDVESEESLRDDYKLEEIASRVDEDLNLQGIIKFNSLKKMFMFICALRNFIDDYIKNKEGYFCLSIRTANANITIWYVHQQTYH